MPERSTGDPALALKLIDLTALFVRFGLPWLAVAAALYWFHAIVESFYSGQPSSEIWISLMANLTRTRAFAFIFGVLGVIYGLQQRELRRRSVSRLRARIAVLEERMQADR